AVACQAARNLACAIGAKVEVDAHIAIADGRQRLTALVHDHKGNNELICHFPVVGLAHSLCSMVIASTLPYAVDHCVEGLLLALPATVAIHGVITPTHAGGLANSVLAHLLLKLLDVGRAVCRQGVAAVH